MSYVETEFPYRFLGLESGSQVLLVEVPKLNWKVVWAQLQHFEPVLWLKCVQPHYYFCLDTIPSSTFDAKVHLILHYSGLANSSPLLTEQSSAFGGSRFVCNLTPWRTNVSPLEYRFALGMPRPHSRFLGHNCDAIGNKWEKRKGLMSIVGEF